MANDRYRWLDEETAEHLLSGVPSTPRSSERFAQVAYPDTLVAARLAATLDELAPARPNAEDGELPGEEAAVAAFRIAREDTQLLRSEGLAERPARRRSTASGAMATPAGRWQPRLPRLGGPLRAGFAIALVGCALGGVAVATGSGMLPTFGSGTGGGTPAPTSSVSTEPGPNVTESGSPEASQGAEHPDREGSRQGTAGEYGIAPPGQPDPDAGRSWRTPDGEHRWEPEVQWEGARELCRAYLGDRLSESQSARLERAAGGAAVVKDFCADRVNLDVGEPAPDPHPDGEGDSGSDRDLDGGQDGDVGEDASGGSTGGGSTGGGETGGTVGSGGPSGSGGDDGEDILGGSGDGSTGEGPSGSSDSGQPSETADPGGTSGTPDDTSAEEPPDGVSVEEPADDAVTEPGLAPGGELESDVTESADASAR